MPGVRVPTTPPGASLRAAAGLLSDEVELYHRTYTTLLRSSGETLVRVLESAHRTMGPSMHALAASDEPDLGALIYATRRLPDAIWQARLVVMGQEREQFVRAGLTGIDDWPPLEAPARRRHWYDAGGGAWRCSSPPPRTSTTSCPCSSPTRSSGTSCAPGCAPPARCPRASRRRPRRSAAARPTGSAWTNAHSLVNLVTSWARSHEAAITDWARRTGGSELQEELDRFESGRTDGSWANFIYYAARGWFMACEDEQREVRPAGEHAVGVRHLSSRTALRISAQVIDLGRLDPDGLDPRLGVLDRERLAASRARIVNIEYPLGLAAYNILREVAISQGALRGVYVLGKAATLSADVGDVMISSVVHDEHSGNTFWLDNAFTVADIQPYLVFGSGLDNQRAVTVKSTFLQNRSDLDFYYQEAFTVVEMEAGPFANAVYEIVEADRHPTGESVNFSKLPIDFGMVHYASDTPCTQARTLGARGPDYYGMDSTYASTVAILRRILALEGIL